MATIPLPPDFKEFLKLLNSHNVKYLLIGGYAVNYYGYARATADMDIWVGISPENADGTSAAVREFGFMQATVHLFLEPGNVIRMGLPPFRIEVLTSVSGVEFSDCFRKRNVVDIGGHVGQLDCYRRSAGEQESKRPYQRSGGFGTTGLNAPGIKTRKLPRSPRTCLCTGAWLTRRNTLPGCTTSPPGAHCGCSRKLPTSCPPASRSVRGPPTSCWTAERAKLPFAGTEDFRHRAALRAATLAGMKF